MKTVGDRIRQAREFRGLSAEELARRVGYKTQSGISNLENRATGRGGYALPKIAQELNISLEWFLQGPDSHDISHVPTYREHLETDLSTPVVTTAQDHGGHTSTRQRCHHLVDLLSEKGITHALEMLEAMVERHPLDTTERAGIHVPAYSQKAA